MKLFLIRHGESAGNVNRTHQGENVPLSEKGENQVHQLAERLKLLEIHTIYASPYLRTRQSAEILSQTLDLHVEYRDELKERRRPSEVEGLSYEDPQAQKINQIIRQNQTTADWKYSDDESYNDMLIRAGKIVDHIESQSAGENIVCVTHIAIMMLIALHCMLKDKLSPEIFWMFYYHAKHSNTGITQLDYSETSGWSLVTWNDTAHL